MAGIEISPTPSLRQEALIFCKAGNKFLRPEPRDVAKALLIVLPFWPASASCKAGPKQSAEPAEIHRYTGSVGGSRADFAHGARDNEQLSTATVMVAGDTP